MGALAVGAFGYALSTAVQSDRPSARPFAALLCSLLVWLLASLCSNLAVLPAAVRSAWLWEALAGVGSYSLPVAWLVYARSYTGHTEWRTPAVTALAVLAALSVALTNLPLPEWRLLQFVDGLVGLSALVGSVVAFCYGTWLLYGLSRRHRRVAPLQVLLLAGLVAATHLVRFAVLIWASLQFAFAERPPEQTLAAIPLGEVPAGFLAAGLLAVVAVRRYPVLGSFPRADAVARATVVRDLREPVVILDYDGYVLDVNASAAETFGLAPDTTGRECSTVAPDLAALDLTPGATGTAWLPTSDGRRQFQFSVSPVGVTPSGEAIARALLLRDVTEQRVREQRLDVFSRVLRHNLRNSLDVMYAYTGEITDPEIREPIRETAEDLEALSEKARRAEQVMAAVEEGPSGVDLSAVVRERTAEFRDRTAELSVSTPETLRVRTYGSVVRMVLDEVLDNAVVHAATPPTVTVTLVESASGVELTITDDGPGLPEHERAVIESGVESQHSHSTGLGLWLVRWGVTQLGGELHFADREPTGTEVTVVLDR
nr:ATP-binding protein [Halovenus carboxidivorans]